MKRYVDNDTLKVWLNEEDNLTARELLDLKQAFETLFDCKARLTVKGNWYGPIDGREDSPFSIHTRGWSTAEVTHFGYKYITIVLQDGSSHKVLVREKNTWKNKIEYTGVEEIQIRKWEEN